MAFFSDRVVQYPGRIKLTPVSGQENTYDVTRAEGTITTVGTPFNASTFNGLVAQIEDQIPDEMYYADIMDGESHIDCSVSPDALKRAIIDLAKRTIEVRHGYASIGSVPANGYTDVYIAFSANMSGVPTVVCSLVSTSTAGAIGSLEAAAIETTESGFTARVFNAGSTARSPGLNYIAVCTS